MRFYTDTYGLALLPPDWYVDLVTRRDLLGPWYDKQDALMAEAADRIMTLLDITMEPSLSGSFPYYRYSDEDNDSLQLYSNFVGDENPHLRQRDYKNFPLLLNVSSHDLDLLVKLEKRFAEAPELHMTLLRRKASDPDNPNPPEILYALPPTTPGDDDTDAETPSDSDAAS